MDEWAHAIPSWRGCPGPAHHQRPPSRRVRPKSERTLIRLSVAEIMKIEGEGQPASGKEGGTLHKGTMS